MIAREEEKQLTLKDWNAVWMMYGVRQRKGMWMRKEYPKRWIPAIYKERNEES